MSWVALSQLISCLFSLVLVTAAIGTGSGKGGGEGRGGGVRPALWLAWADMVTVRLMMLREEGVEDGEEQQKVSHVM